MPNPSNPDDLGGLTAGVQQLFEELARNNRALLALLTDLVAAQRDLLEIVAAHDAQLDQLSGIDGLTRAALRGEAQQARRNAAALRVRAGELAAQTPRVQQFLTEREGLDEDRYG